MEIARCKRVANGVDMAGPGNAPKSGSVLQSPSGPTVQMTEKVAIF